MANHPQRVTAAVPCTSGPLSWLWSLFGVSTPVYAGAGQPAPSARWCGIPSATPPYQAAPPAPPPPASADDDEPTGSDGVVYAPEQGDCVADLPSGPIAVVIRRE